MNRYQELIKENNERILYLGDSYKRIADIYVKKARGYAVKSEDTEIKIRDTIAILEEYDNEHANINVVIPNESKFIEERISKLSKQYKDPDRIKGIIAVTILIAVCIAWFVVGRILARPVKNEAPKNLNAVVSDNHVILVWDKVPTSSSYVIYYINEDTKKRSSSYYENDSTVTFTVEKGYTYTFYVACAQTDIFAQSDTVSITKRVE